jgi:acyl carrier protein phosphodiesterase
MNFLAHFHLAWPDAGLVAGGLEGDYYKGPLRGDLPAAIERGVRLHRAIDAYTDRHPVLEQLRRQFPERLRRYAGILIDISFDHYLSRHWSSFSDIPLGEFSQQVYTTLSEHRQHLSEDACRMLNRLVEHDILGLYDDWETVPASAERIGQRFRRENPFRDIGPELSMERDKLERAFLEFYPDLQAFSAQQETELNQITAGQSKIALTVQTP